MFSWMKLFTNPDFSGIHSLEWAEWIHLNSVKLHQVLCIKTNRLWIDSVEEKKNFSKTVRKNSFERQKKSSIKLETDWLPERKFANHFSYEKKNSWVQIKIVFDDKSFSYFVKNIFWGLTHLNVWSRMHFVLSKFQQNNWNHLLEQRTVYDFIFCNSLYACAWWNKSSIQSNDTL